MADLTVTAANVLPGAGAITKPETFGETITAAAAVRRPSIVWQGHSPCRVRVTTLLEGRLGGPPFGHRRSWGWRNPTVRGSGAPALPGKPLRPTWHGFTLEEVAHLREAFFSARLARAFRCCSAIWRRTMSGCMSPQAARESWHGPAPESGPSLSSRTHSGDARGNVPSNDQPKCNQQPYVKKWVF
jgi:hypothetical protein